MKDYEYRVIWKREGWTSPVRRVYASEEVALRQIQRIQTAVSWKNAEAPPYEEGPWEVKPLLYIKYSRREVGDWEHLPW
jgi:hypothetical protein